MPDPEVRLVYMDAAAAAAIRYLRDAFTVDGGHKRAALNRLIFAWEAGVALPDQDQVVERRAA